MAEVHCKADNLGAIQCVSLRCWLGKYWYTQKYEHYGRLKKECIMPLKLKVFQCVGVCVCVFTPVKAVLKR